MSLLCRGQPNLGGSSRLEVKPLLVLAQEAVGAQHIKLLAQKAPRTQWVSEVGSGRQARHPFEFLNCVIRQKQQGPGGSEVTSAHCANHLSARMALFSNTLLALPSGDKWLNSKPGLFSAPQLHPSEKWRCKQLEGRVAGLRGSSQGLMVCLIPCLPIRPKRPCQLLCTRGHCHDSEWARRGGESCSLLRFRFCKAQEEWNGGKVGSGALGIPGGPLGWGFRLCPCPSRSSQKEHARAQRSSDET